MQIGDEKANFTRLGSLRRRRCARGCRSSHFKQTKEASSSECGEKMKWIKTETLSRLSRIPRHRWDDAFDVLQWSINFTVVFAPSSLPSTNGSKRVEIWTTLLLLVPSTTDLPNVLWSLFLFWNVRKGGKYGPFGPLKLNTNLFFPQCRFLFLPFILTTTPIVFFQLIIERTTEIGWNRYGGFKFLHKIWVVGGILLSPSLSHHN